MEEKNGFKKKLWIYLIVYATVVLAILTVANLSKINQLLGQLLLILRPVTNGLILAYICNPFFRLFERKVFFRLHPPQARRTLSLFCAFLSLFLIVGVLTLLLLPQFFKSVADFASNYTAYAQAALTHINQLFGQINTLVQSLTGKDTVLLEPLMPSDLPTGLTGLFEENASGLSELINAFDFDKIAALLSNAVSAVTDFIFGLFIAIYLLSTKEKRAAQILKFRRAVFGEGVNTYITRICATAHRSFGKFFIGKLFDSLLVALLTYAVTALLSIPYAPLISTLIGITGIIPIFGILIGAIPSAFIILLAEPSKALLFVLIIVLIQLIDSNIISPKILGNNTGVSSLCVIVSISFMGYLWGFAGMLLGVPIFATVLELAEMHVIERLQQKGLPSGLANYYAPDTVVDPTKDIEGNTDKIVKKIEREYLRVQKIIDRDVTAPLTRRQKFYFRTYRLGRLLRLFGEISEEAQILFSTEEAARIAQESSEQSYANRLEIINGSDTQEPQI